MDPVIVVKCFDQDKQTQTKGNKGSGMVYWGEHMFFDKNITVFKHKN